MLASDDTKRGRWGQARRLEFIDSRLCWHGRINRKEITEFFKISVPQASLDLSEYQALAPGNVVYDRTEKAYLASSEFRPVLTDGSSGRYLAELYALSTGVISPDISFLGGVPDADVVRHPTRLVSPNALRTILHAIHDHDALNIHYQTMTRPDPTVRVISPRALAYDGYRWHVRAYCHLREDFRDFVFARILNLAQASVPTSELPPDDEWERELSVIIGPNPALDDNRKRVLALDYGMINERLVVKTRQALAYYLLRRLGLDKPEDKPPQEQQIVLINRDDLVPYLKQLRYANESVRE
jgi:WYL domain